MAPTLRFFHRSLEYRQIDLAHRAFVDNRVGVVAVKLRIVSHEVFDGGADALALHPFYISHGDARREQRVLAEVFEIPPIHRRAIDVDPGSQQEVHSFGPGIPAKLGAHPLGQGRIPGGGQGDAAGHGRGWSKVANSERTIGHFQRGQAKPRDTANEEVFYSSEQSRPFPRVSFV